MHNQYRLAEPGDIEAAKLLASSEKTKEKFASKIMQSYHISQIKNNIKIDRRLQKGDAYWEYIINGVKEGIPGSEEDLLQALYDPEFLSDINTPVLHVAYGRKGIIQEKIRQIEHQVEQDWQPDPGSFQKAVEKGHIKLARVESIESVPSVDIRMQLLAREMFNKSLNELTLNERDIIIRQRMSDL